MNYASEYHYSPFKIECSPKIDDKKQGQKLITELIQLIKPGFMTENPKFNKTILFDIWWIDANGDLQIIIKTLELYVYLCKTDRYPKEVNGTKIVPSCPLHLPPQLIVILKWVNRSILIDEIKEELNSKYKSIFSIQEMVGTINDKTRHIKIEILNKEECISILNSGKISIYGHLFDVDEYLPTPKVLLCGRCHQPGHTKTNCRNSTFDMCRRCGGDRTNIDQHRECQIKCHHCGEEHIATDYKCKIIDNYRRQLIDELKRNTNRLPNDIQLFIPSEYRSPDDKSKSIYNREIYEQQFNSTRPNIPYRTNTSAWPILRESSTSDNEFNLSLTIKTLSEELKQVQQRHEKEQQRIEQKFNCSLMMINQTFTLINQNHQTQQTIVNVMNTAVSKTLFTTCMKTMDYLQLIVNQLVNKIDKDNYDDIIKQINIHNQYLQEAQREYHQHQEELKNISFKQVQVLNQAIDVSSNWNENV